MSVLPINFGSQTSGNVTINGLQWAQNSPGLARSFQRTYNSPFQQRFWIEGGDHYGPDPSTSERVELQGPVTDAYAGIIWWSFSFMVETLAISSGSFLVLGQMHGLSSLGTGDLSPWLEQSFVGQTLNIQTRFSGANPPVSGTPAVRYTTTFTCGVWHNMVYKMQAATTAGNALLSVWMDGSSVYSGTNIDMGYFGDTAPFPKFGIYRGNGGVSGLPGLIARYANVEIGTTDLTARIASPLPTGNWTWP